MAARDTSGSVSSGIRAGILAYVLWGLLTVYWKQLSHFDAFELIAWRILAATVVMAVVISVRGRWAVIRAAFRSRRLVARLAVAAVLLTINWGAYVWAVVHGRIIETALGYFMAPLGTMLLGVLVLHERPSRLQKLALACAAVAVVVLTVSYGRPPVLALLIATTWSVYGLLKRQIPLGAIESLAGETFLLTLPALVYAVVAATAADSIPATAGAGDWALLSLTGVVTAVPLSLVRRRRPAGAVHDPRPTAVPRADDQPPARLARLRRAAAGGPPRRLRHRLARPGARRARSSATAGARARPGTGPGLLHDVGWLAC